MPEDTTTKRDTLDVLELYKQTGAFHEGRFLLASGRQSPYFLQSTTLLQYPKAMMQCGAALAQQIRAAGWNPDFTVGPAMGGVALSYEVARQLTNDGNDGDKEVRGIFAEKDGLGGMKLREAFSVLPDQRFVAVEDVVTTGNSLMRAVKAVEQYGAQCIGVCCIIDRREHEEDEQDNNIAQDIDNNKEARELQGYSLISLAELHFETYATHEIPEWLSQRPLQEI